MTAAIQLTMMTTSDNIICTIPVVMVPIEGQVVARFDFDGVGCLNIAHHIAAYIYGVEIFDGRVCVSSCTGSAVVCGGADALVKTLVYAINENTLEL